MCHVLHSLFLLVCDQPSGVRGVGGARVRRPVVSDAGSGEGPV